ncbi:MAG: hypothetical protein ACXABI_16645 [Candidatus Hodarchaeales archaeon]|jgi:hypothetical protein
MTNVEIVDDSGDEFSVTDVPIPFYIRCKLEGKNVKYRVKLLDEMGNTRGYYTGTSKRDYLELHVPVIPLRKQGKLFIEIELYDILRNELTTRKTTIEYVDQKTYQKLKSSEKPEIESEETEREEFEPLSTENSEITGLPSKISPDEGSPQAPSFELTHNEIAYLTQRTEILQETLEPEVSAKIKEIVEIKVEEEE